MKHFRRTLVLIGVLIAVYTATAVHIGRAISQRPSGWYQGIGVATPFVVIAIAFTLIAVVSLLCTVVLACRRSAESSCDSNQTAGAVVLLTVLTVICSLLVLYPAGVGLSYFVADLFR